MQRSRILGLKTCQLFFSVVISTISVPGIPHASRASRKLFTVDKLAPSTIAYAHLNQKVIKGGASRIFIYWLAERALEKARTSPSNHNGFLPQFFPKALRRVLPENHLNTSSIFETQLKAPCQRAGIDQHIHCACRPWALQLKVKTV